MTVQSDANLYEVSKNKANYIICLTRNGGDFDFPSQHYVSAKDKKGILVHQQRTSLLLYLTRCLIPRFSMSPSYPSFCRFLEYNDESYLFVRPFYATDFSIVLHTQFD